MVGQTRPQSIREDRLTRVRRGTVPPEIRSISTSLPGVGASLVGAQRRAGTRPAPIREGVGGQEFGDCFPCSRFSERQAPSGVVITLIFLLLGLFSTSLSQICPLDLGIIQELLAGAFQYDAAGFKDQSIIRDF